MSIGFVSHPRFSSGGRTIVISDVHGNLPYLRALLEKLAPGAEDRLVLLGDLVEKGPESLATLRYAMSLSDSLTVYPVLGNCDYWHLWVDGVLVSPGWDERTRAHLLQQKRTARRGLVLDMCREAGLPFTEDTDFPRLKGELRERFAPELDYLRAMPYALDTEDVLFVHGGVPADTTPEEAGIWRCLKVDNFYADRPRQKKWTVVGHTPVCLYAADRISAAPIIDPDCRLISIDGGCVLKDDGQLNALIIENDTFSVDWYDPFPTARALDAQEESERSAYIRWGDNAVTLIERGGEFCRVRHDRTGYELEVPTDFLFRREGQLCIADATDYRPAVRPGDTLSVVRETSRGYWVKKDGVTGWYTGRLDFAEE